MFIYILVSYAKSIQGELGDIDIQGGGGQIDNIQVRKVPFIISLKRANSPPSSRAPAKEWVLPFLYRLPLVYIALETTQKLLAKPLCGWGTSRTYAYDICPG
jgi:hypothetical protein